MHHDGEPDGQAGPGVHPDQPARRPADPPALERVKALGYFQAPVVLVEDADGNVVDHWSGFKPDKIQEIADLVGAAPSRATRGPTSTVDTAGHAQVTEPAGPSL